eukprot:TRINITY_DN107816_c0_g1_i1.p1 TRINITY_DN107816_c0_g1~~TRINITY_DN107816_c0_g1_i1.p1  ORF type:complete len:366 (+),score=62.59 TRINITY_DN107816_c0_g1_i1:104-1201(+)
MAKTNAANSLSPAHHAIIGGLVGSIEMAIMKPSVYWKSEMQQGRFSLARAVNPMYCYRGLPIAVASIAPVTCVQFLANSLLLRGMGAACGCDAASTTDSQRLVAGVFSGFASAAAQSPMQLVEINQQNFGSGMAATVRRIVSCHGLSGLYTAYPMTAIREGIFVTSYMAAAPLLRREIHQRYPTLSESAAMAASAILAGGVGAAMSHPADTLKTKLQGGLFPNGLHGLPATDNTITQKLREMATMQGSMVSSLYAGFAPRFFRIICCTFIYGTLKELFERLAMENLQKQDRNDRINVSVALPASEYLPASCSDERRRFERDLSRTAEKVCAPGTLRIVLHRSALQEQSSQAQEEVILAQYRCEPL